MVFGSMKAYPFRPERQRQEMIDTGWKGPFFIFHGQQWECMMDSVVKGDVNDVTIYILYIHF